MDQKKLSGHASMLGAEFLWGVSAPLGKFILAGGVAPLLLTDCRVAGAAVLFWLISLFSKGETVNRRDHVAMFFASMFGIVLNQGCFVWGLSLTSPINASIITTSLPILTMVMAAIVLREPITRMKAGGVVLGAAGALILILGNHGGGQSGSWAGDVLVICAQLSFCCYLVLFKRLIAAYRPVTLMKWMFTYATVCMLPLTLGEWAEGQLFDVAPAVLLGVAAFVVGPTFLSYLLLPIGQRYLRPTVTAMYNYVQPIVSTLVAIATGLGQFTAATGIAIILVFSGVALVTRSKSRADIERERTGSAAG